MVESRTSIRGSVARSSILSAKVVNPKDTSLENIASTINSEKNPPSEGIKVEIQKNAQIGPQSNALPSKKMRVSAPIY